MKLLLDTHVWYWSVAEPKRVVRRISSLLSKSTNELWLSPVSTWEILALCRKGRMRLDLDPVQWIEITRAKMPMREAPLTHEVALATRNISLPHNDPMDFLLAATAKVHGLTLITADTQLLAGKGFSVLSARG